MLIRFDSHSSTRLPLATIASLLLLPIALLFISARIAKGAEADTPPNVVVILVDDMGWSDIGPYGSEIATPNLDALAAGGLRYTQFYNTGRCSPTRASLLTGHYPHQAGMGHLDNKVIKGHLGFQGKIADTSVTIAEVLKDAGYFTAMTGKWHLGHNHGTTPPSRGFMRSLNLARGGVYYWNQTGSKGGAKLYLNGEEKDSNDPQFGEWYGTYLWAEQGLKFIDEARSEKKPFFLYLAHVAPHFPLMAPEEEIAKYRGKYLVGWDELRKARHQRQIEMGLVDAKWPLSERPSAVPAWTDVPEEKRKRFDDLMAIYAATITTMDRSVGMVVDGLRERGELDNTLILFISDNGGNAESGPNGKYEGDHPGDAHSNIFLGQNWATLNNTPFRRYKHWVHEGGAATPLIAHWPNGINASLNGTLNHQPGHVIDVMATVREITVAEFPTQFAGHDIAPMQGISLKPTFQGRETQRKSPIFFNHEDNKAVRDGKWKLVKVNRGKWELYDMEADRTETNDLSAQHTERVKDMTAAYENWARQTHVVSTTAVPQNLNKPNKPKRKRNQQPALP